MPQYPGNDTVTFTYPGVQADRLHKVNAVAGSNFTQRGCSMQPINVKDKIDNTQYSEATDRCFAVVNDSTTQVKAEWFIGFNGLDYRVLGTMPYRDFWGNSVYVAFICKEETPT